MIKYHEPEASIYCNYCDRLLASKPVKELMTMFLDINGKHCCEYKECIEKQKIDLKSKPTLEDALMLIQKTTETMDVWGGIPPNGGEMSNVRDDLFEFLRKFEKEGT